MNGRELDLELRRRIFASHSAGELGAQAIREFCKGRIEVCKERLLRCSTHHEMTGLQGEALAYAVVLKTLTEPMRETPKSTSVDNQ